MLVSGVLYQDDTSRDLRERVSRCVALYFKRRGTLPDVAYVNPAELNGETHAGTVHLVGHKTVLPTHYLLSAERLPVVATRATLPGICGEEK